MPSPTFHNLPSDKRQRFLDAATAEFAVKGFHGGSLTQLVKYLGIAKGSLYQYFKNKEDIFHYLIRQACSHRAAFFDVLEGKPNKDYTFNYLIISLKFDVTYPQMACLVYNGLTTFDPDILELLESEFCNQIPKPIPAEGIALLCSAFANFSEFIKSRDLNLDEIITNKREIPLSSEELLKIMQKRQSI